MPKKIRVLQLHNLNIGPFLTDSPFTTLRSFFDRLDKPDKLKLANGIDYLVVCGNFTRDRSKESFRHAKRVLFDLAREFLPPTGPLANRVVLVPGPLDVPDPNADSLDFEAFRQFYEDFFQDRFGVDRKFDPQRAELRELKDLTLVALTYWRSTDPDISKKRIRSFGEALGGAIRSMSSLAYVNTTPTLLVSAGTPLFPNGHEWPAANPQVQKVFNTDLRISFHLFGEGPLAYVPPEPFSYDHVSLGLGSEAVAGSLWPLRVNVLELDGDPSTGQRLGVDWTVLRQRASGETPEERTFLGALETKNIPTQEPKLEELYFDFLERLSFHMSQPETRMIHVQGFPGSGISEVFKRLTVDRGEKLQEIGGSQICIHGHRWKDKADFTNFLKGLCAQVGTTSGCSAHLAVLYDPSYSLIANKKDRLQMILDSSETFFEKYPFKLVYLTNFADFSFNLDGRKELPFRALQDKIVTDLLGRYTCRVPLHGGEVAHLTGGYAGWSERCLIFCKNNFENWPGAEGIGERTSATLLGGSFSDPEVLETCKRFLASIKTPSGEKLFDKIRKTVMERYERHAKGELELSHPIEVDFDTRALAENKRLRDHLANYQILDHKGASKYTVRVVAPFLGRRITTVFFSYHSDIKKYVAGVRSHLKLKAQQEKSEIRILDYYSAQDWQAEAALSIEERVNRRLAMAPNLCVFLATDSIGRQSVFDEIKVWQRKWKQSHPGQSAGIVVIPQGCDLPEALEAFEPVDKLDEEADMAETIFDTLVFPDMVWGFDFD